MSKLVVIVDCLPHYHHPIGHPELCVPDAQPVPTLDASAVIALGFALLVVAWIGRKA